MALNRKHDGTTLNIGHLAETANFEHGYIL